MSDRPAHWSPAEAVEQLQTAASFEAFSPLTGRGVLAVDLTREAGTPSNAHLERARALLRQLPCPSVGVGLLSATALGRSLAGHLDVALTEDAEAEPILDAIAQRPLAAAALVQLLRMGERLDLHEALVAESLVYSTLQSGPEFAEWLASRGPLRPPPTQREPAVRVWRTGPRLELTLNRPARHNAFSVEMRDALVAGLELALADDTLREIALSGEGPSFCSGGDLDEFGTFPDPATAHAVRSARNPARLLALCAGRVRVQVQGACVGAGVELPAFAKHVMATEDAFFQLPEVAMGLVPGSGGTASIPRRIGRQRTAWLALSNARIGASTALDWGLIDEIDRVD